MFNHITVNKLQFYDKKVFLEFKEEKQEDA